MFCVYARTSQLIDYTFEQDIQIFFKKIEYIQGSVMIMGSKALLESREESR